MWSWMLQVVPFVLVAAFGGVELAVGSRWGVLSLVAVGPALAATLGGVRLVLAVGAEALVICALFAAVQPAGSEAYHRALTASLVVLGVTAGGCLASAARTRRDRDLAKVRLVAEAAQKVVLRPVPREVGPLKLAMRYLSASEEARVGGDLYDVVSTPDCVRMVVGDAEGKGLAALQSASAVLGVFREAAHEEASLAAIVSRIESSLARDFGDEEFVTAIFAEFSADGAKMELLSCGHPDPLLLGPAGPRFIGSGQESLPLGLGHLTGEPHSTLTIAFEPGDQVLFYTDGIAEARNRAGEFFPLAECASLRTPQRPDTLVDRLCNEMNKYVGHAPDDDVALLLVSRDKALRVPLSGKRSRSPASSSSASAASSSAARPQPSWLRQAIATHERTDAFYEGKRAALPSCSPRPVRHAYAEAVPSWKAIEQAEPEFAGRVRRLFDAGRHKTIATLRADGSPRISGIECEFTDGDLRFGSMTGARKGADLKRDPRFALHGPTFHPEEGKESEWPGEAKIAGRAIPAGPVTTDEASEQPDGEVFAADITEVVITRLNAEATQLVVESWTPERGLRRVERD